jgi:tetratricopeptide (TPR) repeat protein
MPSVGPSLPAMRDGTLTLSDKGEVSGNLVSGVLSGRGVSSFSIGEYFEAKPLVEIVHPNRFAVKTSAWVDGVAYRTLDVNSSELIDALGAHEDTLVYRITNPLRDSVELGLSGGLQVFSWFNPDFRARIAKQAAVEFESIEGFGLSGSYGHVYNVCLASNRAMACRIRIDAVEFAVSAVLEQGDSIILAVCGAAGEADSRRLAERALEDPSRVEQARKDQVRSTLSGVSKPQGMEPKYEKLWDYMWYVLLLNRARVSNHPTLRGHFTMPSKFVFRHQWLWDSSFHAVVLSEYDMKLAEEELSNLFYAQKSDGRIPHEIFISKELCGLFWNVDDYSPWTTQPPVIAVAVRHMMQRGVGEVFLRRVFQALDHYDRWFRAARDADGDQLMAYTDYLESGWDNAVRWDEAITRFERAPSKYRSQYPEIRMAPVEAIDLNCYIYIQRKTLADIAEKLGLVGSAEEYRQLAGETLKGIRSLMWDSSDGFYYDIYEEGHVKIKVKTPAAFSTLYAGIASRDEASKLVQHLMRSGEFWTSFTLPTVSADDPGYDPKGYWRGRSWINQVWLTYWGLRKYGYDEEARGLAERVLAYMVKGPNCNENYDSQTGEPLGAQDFGWSTLMLTIMREIYRQVPVDS